MSLGRALACAGAIVVALVLQVTFFPHLAWRGVVPNLCLLVVVAGALVRGAQFGVVLGFLGGLALDLAPPAQHLAGQWALSLMAVGYVAGMVRRDVRPTFPAIMATVGVCSFVGTSLFAILGVVAGDPGVPVGQLLLVVLLGVAWDLLLAPVLLPALMLLLGRFETDRRLA